MANHKINVLSNMPVDVGIVVAQNAVDAFAQSSQPFWAEAYIFRQELTKRPSIEEMGAGERQLLRRNLELYCAQLQHIIQTANFYHTIWMHSYGLISFSSMIKLLTDSWNWKLLFKITKTGPKGWSMNSKT